MSGTISPVPRFQFFDDEGEPLAGGLLYSYTAGTSTPIATYTDSALTVANLNPIVLDAAGRCAIYLSTGLSYKFVMKTSLGATVWTQNAVGAVPDTSDESTFNGTCDLRLTYSSGVPVPSSDVTTATVLYATPYKGNRIALYDGTVWTITNCDELSINMGGQAVDTNFDVFVYIDPILQGPTLDVLGWTSATARNVALASQDGVYVKSTDATWRYLGTMRTTSTLGQSEDSAAKRFLWNYYHRTPRILRVAPLTDSWTYTTATYRQANGDTANQVAIVVGLAEASLELQLQTTAQNTLAGTPLIVAIAEDGASTPATGSLMSVIDTPAINTRTSLTARLATMPAIGYHYYPMLEYSGAAGVTTWYGDGGAPTLLQSGLIGSIVG